MKRLLLTLIVLSLFSCSNSFNTDSIVVTGGLRIRHFDRATDNTLAFWISGPSQEIDKIQKIGFFSNDTEGLIYSMFQKYSEDEKNSTIFIQSDSKKIDTKTFKLKINNGSKWSTLSHPVLENISPPVPLISQLETSRGLKQEKTVLDLKDIDTEEYDYTVQVYDLTIDQLMLSQVVKTNHLVLDLSVLTNSGQYLFSIIKQDTRNTKNILSREYEVSIK